MCGFVAAVGSEQLRTPFEAAHRRQFHRGPDAQETQRETIAGQFVGLAHQRLAVVDLSEHGVQPMSSLSGRLTMVFNGEIYNYAELATKHGLEGEAARNDTKVALELIERMGINKACAEFNGMWAMAVLDRQLGQLHLSRDRVGKKPLYWTQTKDGFAAASEMHSLLSFPGLEFKPDLVTAARFLGLSLQNVDERSWAEGIKSIAPGTVRTLSIGEDSVEIGDERFFWPTAKIGAIQTSIERTEDEWVAFLRDTLEDAVGVRLRADVPVGIALSGGIDSSVLCAIASQQGAADKTTFFSAVSPGQPEDESKYVDMVAANLGIPVEKVELSDQDSSNILDEVALCSRFHDGPLTSFSPLLFRRLMARAREMGITVILTGQGADEAFCGYRKYPYFALRQLLRERKPAKFAMLAAQLLQKGAIGNFKLSEAKRYLGRSEAEHLGPALANVDANLTGGNTLAERQWDDVSKFSVPALCHYEDRMSMSVSREVRSPFLDYRMIELGLAMPMEMKLGRGWTKYALRQAYANALPNDVIWRRDKKGFANPENKWLRASRDQAIEMMSAKDAPVYRYGLIKREPYLALLKRYMDGDDRIWFREAFAPISTNIWLDNVENGNFADPQG